MKLTPTMAETGIQVTGKDGLNGTPGATAVEERPGSQAAFSLRWLASVVREVLRGDADKFFALADALAISVGRLVVNILLARLLSVDRYATFVLFVTCDIILQTMSLALFISPFVSVAAGLDAGRRQALISHVLKRQSRWLWSMAVVAIPVAPLAAYWHVHMLTYLGFVTAVLVGIWAEGERSRLRSLFCMRRALVADVVGIIVPVISLGVAHALEQNVLAWFWWTRAACAALTGAMMNVHGRVAKSSLSAEDVRRVRELAVPMTLGAIANSACSRMLPFVLQAAAGSLHVSLFGAASTLVGPTRMVATSLGQVLRPRVSLHFQRGQQRACRRSLLIAVTMVVAVGGGLWLAYAAGGTALVVLLFQGKYGTLATVLPAACVFAIADGVNICLMVALQVTVPRGAVYGSRVRIIASVVSLLLVFPACAMWGVAGAFLVLLVTEMVYGVWVARILYHSL